MTAHRDGSPTSPPPSGRLRAACAVVLALAGVFVFSSGSARASCGSHVTVLPAGATAADLAPMGHPVPPCPCSGPSCSRQPVTPPASPVVPSVRVLADEANGLASLTLAVEDPSAPRAEVLRPLHPRQQPRSIFRPPRPSSRS